MKKILCWLLACILLATSLSGCGGGAFKGTWEYSLNGDTSTLKFSGADKVVWTLKEDGEVKKYEGKYSYDAEDEKMTIVLTGWGSGTYDADSISIDFIGLPHRKK